MNWERYGISFRVRQKDKELREFLLSLDDSVDLSDAIRTCALIGIRSIGGMFPKRSDFEEVNEVSIVDNREVTVTNKNMYSLPHNDSEPREVVEEVTEETDEDDDLFVTVESSENDNDINELSNKLIGKMLNM